MNATTALHVRPTATTLTLAGTRTETRTVRLEGQLVTTGGLPIPTQRVGLSANGELLTTTRTDQVGRFATVVTLPPPVPRNTTVNVTAAFDGTGTNLAGRRTPAAGPGETDAAGDAAAAVDAAVTEAPAASAQEAGPTARDHVLNGQPDAGVIAVYTTLRANLTDQLGLDGRETHWEVLARYRTADVDTLDPDTLRRLTEVYERAAFAPREVPRKTAEEVLALLDGGTESDGQPGD